MTISNRGCGKTKPHWAHFWRSGFLKSRKNLCPGVPPHRHSFKLTTTLITPHGYPVDFKNIYWQCDCWAIRWWDREDFHKGMLGQDMRFTWER